jgi:hypothetical protein
MKKIENVYMLLPRFVLETEVRDENGHFRSAVFKDFERNGMRFTLVILPATIHNTGSGSKHYYPGEREELVELVLRKMAIDENPNFIKEDLVLMFNLRFFLDYIKETDKEASYTSDEIELALQILTSTQYELHKKHIGLSFNAIDELRSASENEEIYYYARLNRMFLGNNTIFDRCFGNKNPNKSKTYKGKC